MGWGYVVAHTMVKKGGAVALLAAAVGGTPCALMSMEGFGGC